MSEVNTPLWVSQVCSALCWLLYSIVFIWCLSLHAVAAGLKSWLGPLAGESGLAQDSVALGSLEVLWAGDCCKPPQIHGPLHSHLGLCLWLMELGGRCWVGHTLHPLLSLVVPYLRRPDAEWRPRRFSRAILEALHCIGSHLLFGQVALC